MTASPPLIGVVGGGRASSEEQSSAHAVGRLLAERGAVLVCGGLGGVMEAASRGAAEAGGTVVGLLPGSEPGAANRWVTLPLATGLGEARNTVIASACRGLIAVGGEWGTLSEIALAKKAGKPVVALIPRTPLAGVLIAPSPKDAVETLWLALGLTPGEKD